MTGRRAAAAVSVVLLIAVSVAVAESSLLVMLLLFSSILRLNFGVELGDQWLTLYAPRYTPVASVVIHHAGTIASLVFTLACGVGAASWRYRRWRPA